MCFPEGTPTVLPLPLGTLSLLLVVFSRLLEPLPAPPPPRCCLQGVSPFPAAASPFLFLAELLFLRSPRSACPWGWAPPCLPLPRALPPLFLFLVGPASAIVHSQERAILLVEGLGMGAKKKASAGSPPPLLEPAAHSGVVARVPASFLEISVSKFVSGCNLTSTCGG